MEEKPSKENSTPSGIKNTYDVNFDDNYIFKLYYDNKDDVINIICYDIGEMENKKYEVKISKFELDIMNKLFKIYDSCQEIYDLIIENINSEKYEINNAVGDDKLTIKLHFSIAKNDFEISLDMKSNTQEDLSPHINYLLKNEIVKHRKEIKTLKEENESIRNELNDLKQIVDDLINNKNAVVNKDERNDSLKSKKEIDITGKKIDNNFLKNLSNYPNLEKLILCNCKISDINIMEKCRFKQLQILHLSNNQIKDIAVFLKFQFQKLNELDLNHNKITNLEPLSKIDLTHLQKIDLSNNHIEDISMLDRITAPHLKYLNLSHNSISDISVFGTVEFKEMTELCLDANNLDFEYFSYVIDYLKSKISKFSYH
jgi:hypothetical protein